MTDTLLLNQDGPIATLRFNRPAQMNSLNDAMAHDLLETVRAVSQSEQVRVLILQGAGKQFMAGGDVGFFYQSLNNLADCVGPLIDQVHQTIMLLRTMPQIVLACVHGAAAGFGMSLMLACDLTIAAQDTKFTSAYSKIGTSPDGGMSYFLPRVVGHQRAMESLLLADIWDAKMAEAMGILNWVVPSEQLEEKTLQIAKRIAQGPTLAYTSIKRLLNNSLHNTLAQQLDQEKHAFVSATQTTDFKSGVTAFVQKTTAQFKGN